LLFCDSGIAIKRAGPEFCADGVLAQVDFSTLREYRLMALRWPFSTKPVHPVPDDHTISHARAELALAEAALVAARAAYLRLRNSYQPPAVLRLHQSALDQALHRYHAARHALRALDRSEIGVGAWTPISPRRRANEGRAGGTEA
jgi:hypothetical protein